MANIKITDLAELAATPADADILEIVDDVAGTATSKKITAANLRADIIVSDTIWDAEGDTIYGTGANTAAKLAAGAANDKYFMDAAGTAPEWAGGLKIGTFTRDLTTATGDVAYSGVGFKPTILVFIAGVIEVSTMSIGIDDGTNSYSVYDNYYNLNFAWAVSSTLAICVIPSPGISQSGLVKTLDADGFTVTWTKTGLPTGTATVYYLAIR